VNQYQRYGLSLEATQLPDYGIQGFTPSHPIHFGQAGLQLILCNCFMKNVTVAHLSCPGLCWKPGHESGVSSIGV
jgi:hypothetical protein